MRCKYISIHEDGTIFCTGDNRIGLPYGTVDDVPADLDDHYQDAIRYWKSLNTQVPAIHPYIKLSVYQQPDSRPVANINTFFSIQANSEYAKKLEGELNLLARDLEMMGCHAIVHKTSSWAEGGPWWRLGKHRRTTFQFNLVRGQDELGDEQVVKCLSYFLKSVEDTRLSEFIVPNKE